MKTADELSDLIHRAQRLDADAFEQLVDAYAPRLFGFLYRLTGHRDDAEELVQEVFVRLVRVLKQYEHDGRFDAWLFRIATNLARDRIRKLTRSPEIASLDVAETGSEGTSVWDRLGDLTSPPPEQRIEVEEDAGHLEGFLAKLPQAEREVILLRHYTRMSFAEIAEVMGTPLGTALARSHRGLAKLRQWMEEPA